MTSSKAKRCRISTLTSASTGGCDRLVPSNAGTRRMRLLFLGDVVGRTGRRAVFEELPRLRERYKLDFVAVNGENAAGGFGITEAILQELLDAGADAVTLGNHAFDQK